MKKIYNEGNKRLQRGKKYSQSASKYSQIVKNYVLEQIIIDEKNI
jgi:outer membrane protein assembly factor BamD (BamD/ComL family)